MACCGGGHHEDRFQTSVDKNFFCPICQEVLKDPVQCHNEHYFCKACITQHLKNSKTCPVCMEKVTEETLTEPPRIVMGYLDGLIINCDHSERGCTELIELGSLETHIRVCKYRPVTCPNEKCAAMMNWADLEQHTSEVCEYRQVYCEECGEDMSFKKYGKHGCFISKDVNAIKVALLQVQDQVKEISSTQKELSKTQKELSETQKELSETQKEMFKVIKSLSEVNTMKGEASATPKSKPQGNIVVVGGQNGMLLPSNWLNSVEMYSLATRTWSKLAPMQEQRSAPTAHFYNGQVMVTGGFNSWTKRLESIEYIQFMKQTNLASRFLQRPLLVRQLPFESYGHKTAILDDRLWVVGGLSRINNQSQSSKAIHMTHIYLPSRYVVKYQMPRPLSFHGLEIIYGNNLLIIGGTTTGRCVNSMSAVLLYNTVTNTLQELHPLPFPMLDMATVKHGEDVIIIGGQNKDGEYLNTVFKYNCKKNECEQLPGMKCKRSECAAVICGNKVFVMGGYNKEQGYLSSVECFDLDDQVWYELPSMSEAKYKIAAVLVP